MDVLGHTWQNKLLLEVGKTNTNYGWGAVKIYKGWLNHSYKEWNLTI